MNQTIIIGNLTRDPELRTTQSGKGVCGFDVAVNKKVNGDDRTSYFKVSAWDKLGDTCARYLAKGRKVMVIGEVSARAYEGRDGTPKASLELTAREVEFLSPASEAAAAPAPAATTRTPDEWKTARTPPAGDAGPSIMDGAEEIMEDLPF